MAPRSRPGEQEYRHYPDLAPFLERGGCAKSHNLLDVSFGCLDTARVSSSQGIKGLGLNAQETVDLHQTLSAADTSPLKSNVAAARAVAGR